jgi:hypothetical protein
MEMDPSHAGRGGMHMSINGKSHDMTHVDVSVKLGTTETFWSHSIGLLPSTAIGTNCVNHHLNSTSLP